MPVPYRSHSSWGSSPRRSMSDATLFGTLRRLVVTGSAALGDGIFRTSSGSRSRELPSILRASGQFCHPFQECSVVEVPDFAPIEFGENSGQHGNEALAVALDIRELVRLVDRLRDERSGRGALGQFRVIAHVLA